MNIKIRNSRTSFHNNMDWAKEKQCRINQGISGFMQALFLQHILINIQHILINTSWSMNSFKHIPINVQPWIHPDTALNTSWSTYSLEHILINVQPWTHPDQRTALNTSWYSLEHILIDIQPWTHPDQRTALNTSWSMYRHEHILINVQTWTHPDKHATLNMSWFKVQPYREHARMELTLLECLHHQHVNFTWIHSVTDLKYYKDHSNQSYRSLSWYFEWLFSFLFLTRQLSW